MSKMKRFFALVVCLLLTVTLVAMTACDNNGGPQENTKGNDTEATQDTTKNQAPYEFDKNTKAKIRLYLPTFYTVPGPSIEDPELDMLEDFKNEYPNVQIELVDITANLTNPHEKIIADTAAGIPPDVFYTRTQSLQTLADQEIVYCLDEYIERDPSGVANLVDGALNLTTYNNKAWMLPNMVITYNMYYNKALFDKMGVEYPTDDWTLEDLREIARKLTRHEGDSISLGLALDYLPFWITGATGAKPMVKDGDRWEINIETDPGSIKAVETLLDMIERDKIFFTDEEWASTGKNKNSIRHPNIGMMFMGTFGYKDREGSEWFCVLPPKGPNGERTTFVQAFLFGMHTNAADKDACWELLKYLNSDEQLKKTGLWLPPDRPVLPTGLPMQKIFFERDDVTPQRQAAINKHLEIYDYWVPLDVFPMNGFGPNYYNMAVHLYEGTKDLATAMKDLKRQSEKLYNKETVE